MRHRSAVKVQILRGVRLALLLSLASCGLWVSDQPDTAEPEAIPAVAANPEKAEPVKLEPASADPVPTEESAPDTDPLLVPEWYTLDAIAPENPVGAVQPQPVAGDRAALVAQLTEGKYLVDSVAGCGQCHSAPKPARPVPGVALSGGRTITDSYGTIVVPNITPDIATGIGSWSVAEVMEAFRASLAKDSRTLSLDVHAGYRWMSDKHARSIALYLLSQRPVKNEIEHRELGLFARKKMGIVSRHAMLKGYVPELPSTQAISQLGRYISLHVAACGQCHSDDRADFLAQSVLSGTERRSDRSLVGSLVGFAKFVTFQSDDGSDGATDTGVAKEILIPPGAPNIRGTDADGLKNWTAEQIVAFLDSGKSPDGKAADDCPWQFYRGMSARDKQAIAKFLKTL